MERVDLTSLNSGVAVSKALNDIFKGKRKHFISENTAQEGDVIALLNYTISRAGCGVEEWPSWDITATTRFRTCKLPDDRARVGGGIIC